MNHVLTAENLAAEERTKLMTWPCTYVENLEFRHLVDTFESVGDERKKTQQYEKLLSGELYKIVRDKDESIFQLLRLIIPKADRSRGQYGLAVKKIAKQYIDALHLKGDDSNRLEHHDNPNYFEGCEGVVVGDFSSALMYVLRNRVIPHNRQTSRWTIRDVNEKLDQLEKVSTNKEYNVIFSELIQHCSAKENKWFVRIILQDLKIGVKEDGLLSYLHEDAKDMYHMCRELSLVCGVLRDPKRKYTPTLILTLPCCPMLADKSRTWKDVSTWISKSLNGGTKFCFEEKLDGHRMMLHKKGNEIKVFSRAGIDHTEEYGQFFKKFARENIMVNECIIDGELIAWDNRAKRVSEFNSNLKSLFDHYLKRPGATKQANEYTRDGILTTDYTDMWPCYSIFDILYVGSAIGGSSNGSSNGTTTTTTTTTRATTTSSNSFNTNNVSGGNLLAHTLTERKKILKRVIKPALNLFYLTPFTILEKSHNKTPKKLTEQLKDELDKIVELRKEGLMLKAMDTPYMLGERSRNTKHWVKLKPEYLDTLAGYLDLIVLGGYYSSSSRKNGRQGLISHFLLGVKDDTVNEDTPDSDLKFHTLCKVGTGYDFHQVRDMNKHLMEQSPAIHHFHEKNTKAALPRHFMGWKPKKRDDVPDVWFDPKESIVFEILGAEFQNTEQFKAGVTVRFPRVKEIRDDKNWFDIMSISEVKAKKLQLASTSNRRRSNRNDMDGDSNSDYNHRRKKIKTNSLYSLTDTSQIVPENEILKGYTFCVMVSQTVAERKGDIAKRIRLLGGTLQANPPSTGCCPVNFFIVTPKMEGDKLNNIQKKGQCDILSELWLNEVESQKKFIPPYDKDEYFFAMRGDKRIEYMDKYGDMYYRETDVKSLKNLFERMDRRKSKSNRGIHNQNEMVVEDDNSRLLSATAWRKFFKTVNNDDDGSVADLLLNNNESVFQSMIFAKLVFYLEMDTTNENNNVSYTSLPFQIRMYGGTIVESINNSKITHVVKCHNNDSIRHAIRLDDVNGSSDDDEENDNNNMQFRQYVNVDWVKKCISEKMLVSTLL